MDHVEKKIYEYIKGNELVPGDRIPHKRNLSEPLGVARSVLREALNRLKMIGVKYSRSRRGMFLCEPNLLGGMEWVIDPINFRQEKDPRNIRFLDHHGSWSSRFYLSECNR